MLYTGRGDDGTTTLCNASGRVAKNAATIEALGAVDELNSWFGICKTEMSSSSWPEVIEEIQQNLFTIQAEIAGTDLTITNKKVSQLEDRINKIEKQLPEIKSFLLSGGTSQSAHLGYARAVSRRAERRVLSAIDSDQLKISVASKAYLNRLSSFCYALERLLNVTAKTEEKKPTYN